MTLRKAESITGYEVVRLDLDGIYFQARDGAEIVAAAGGKTEKEALQRLVDAVYTIHCDIVRRLQRYRCADCSAMAGLTVHHKVFRSHGRDDRVSNLVAMCNQCHENRHKNSKEYREHGRTVEAGD